MRKFCASRPVSSTDRQLNPPGYALVHEPDNHESQSRGDATMIDLYTCATPNGQKIHIMLEEAKLEHTDH
ncbi:MAG: hypothetical protein VYA71_00565, partial [Pseudomonadota bacterium]|nr:hypothetical protein [Pseudomonadota bacterium]